MKIVSRLIAALTLVALTGSVFAQSVSVGSVIGQKGNQVVLEPSFTAGAQEVDIVQFLVTFANPTLANFSAVTVAGTCGGTLGTNNQCVVSPTANAFQVIVSNGTNAMPTGILASITFTIDGAATAGDVALVVDPTSIVIGRDGAAANPPVPVSDGNITITDGPQPAFGVAPAAIDISGQIGAGTIAAGVTVDNTGEADSILNYTCIETADSNDKFTIGGDITNIDLAVGAQGFPSASCDRTVDGGPFTGNMQCTHNGSNTSPVDIPLTCNISLGPQAMFSGTPTGLDMVAVEQGDADPAGSLAITNSGDATTTVAGTCTLTGPDAQISLTNGAFSVDEGAAAHVVAVSCDASAEGMYTNTLSCGHDGANATPVDYAVTCNVGPPGPSVYLSVPAPGAVIDMTAEDVPVDSVVPDQVVMITNDAAEADDSAMGLSCAWVGSAEITVTAPTGPVAAQTSTSATFSCSTAAVGAYTGTYTCNYADDGDELLGTAAYTVNCGVRAAASDILEGPISGTALSILVPLNGTGQAIVNFSEILDEGEDATIDSCTFGTAIFSVVTALPADVLAGGSTAVTVTGTDPGTGELSFTDTLTCTYTDSDSAPGTASWPITMTVLAQPIPTLSVWGLLLMILTLMGMGGMVIRSRVRS